MTWQKFPLTAVLIASIAGCSNSCEWHAGSRNGTSTSSQSSGSEQPAQPTSSREGSREVRRVTVRNRPPVDREQHVTPTPTVTTADGPAPVNPGSPYRPGPSDGSGTTTQPATTDGGGTGSNGSTGWNGIRHGDRGRHDDASTTTPAPATTGQADTPSNTPEPAPATTDPATNSPTNPDEVLRRRTDKQTAEEREAAEAKKRGRLRSRGKDNGGSTAPTQKTDRR